MRPLPEAPTAVQCRPQARGCGAASPPNPGWHRVAWVTTRRGDRLIPDQSVPPTIADPSISEPSLDGRQVLGGIDLQSSHRRQSFPPVPGRRAGPTCSVGRWTTPGSFVSPERITVGAQSSPVHVGPLKGSKIIPTDEWHIISRKGVPHSLPPKNYYVYLVTTQASGAMTDGAGGGTG